MELDRYQGKKSRPEVKELKVNRRAAKKKSPTRETGEDGESESDAGTRRRTPEPPELGEEKAGLVTTKSSQVTKRKETSLPRKRQVQEHTDVTEDLQS